MKKKFLSAERFVNGYIVTLEDNSAHFLRDTELCGLKPQKGDSYTFEINASNLYANKVLNGTPLLEASRYFEDITEESAYCALSPLMRHYATMFKTQNPDLIHSSGSLTRCDRGYIVKVLSSAQKISNLFFEDPWVFSTMSSENKQQLLACSGLDERGILWAESLSYVIAHDYENLQTFNPTPQQLRDSCLMTEKYQLGQTSAFKPYVYPRPRTYINLLLLD